VSDDPYDIAMLNFEKAYATLLHKMAIDNTRLARIGFYQVVKKIVTENPFPDAGVQAKVLRVIDEIVDPTTSGLENVVRGLLATQYSV
jgi:hypothetical protein